MPTTVLPRSFYVSRHYFFHSVDIRHALDRFFVASDANLAFFEVTPQELYDELVALDSQITIEDVGVPKSGDVMGDVFFVFFFPKQRTYNII